MREVFGLTSAGGGGVSRKLDEVQSGRMNNNSCTNKSVKVNMASTPGYLELSPDKMEKLICHKPIEEFYEVEDQPFARGKYAAVRRATQRSTGQSFAAKFLRKRRRSADLRPEILHEVAVLEACAGCSRVVRLHQVFESPSEMVLLLELAPGGELQMLLDKDEVPEEHQVKRLMRQILDGLVFLHSINVAHLDIKPQNLVLTADFPQGEVKLCDLGISRYISPGADIRDILGTPDYVAPEVLNYEPISLATDMWSVGVILYVLLTGFSPFGGDTKQETFCNISQCRLDFPDDLFEDVSEEAKDLMRKLMVKDPSKRLSADGCLRHPWFSTSDPIAQPLAPAVRSSEKIQVKLSPVTSRKLEITGSQNTTTRESTVIPSSPKITRTFSSAAAKKEAYTNRDANKSSVVDNITRRDVSVVGNLLETCTAKDGNMERAPSGISSFRKNEFKKRLQNLSRSFNEDNNNNLFDNDSSIKTTNFKLSVFSNVATGVTAPSTENTNSNLRSINKATAMKTMPVNGLSTSLHHINNLSVVPQRRQQNLNITRTAPSENVRQLTIEKDCMYKFRKCYIRGDEEEYSVEHNTRVNTKPAMHGSVNSIGTESGYSDNSGSDSMSEMSIDSSSDRSSIISLDDSLMEYNYSKVNGRPYPNTTYSVSRSLWEGGAAHSRSEVRREGRVLARDCSNTFAKALSKFSVDSRETEKHVSSVQNVSTRRQAPKYAYTSALNKVLISRTIAMSSESLTGKKVEVKRERNGNIVIREANPGKYMLVKEMKCESVQSRIRKLQEGKC